MSKGKTKEAISYVGISKLISNETMITRLEAGEHLHGRCTGKSFGQSLAVLAELMQDADKEGITLTYARPELCSMQQWQLQEIITRLQLKYFEVIRNSANCSLTVKYNILRGQFSQQEKKEIDHESERI